MADIKISELTSVSSLNNGDLVEVSQVNELAPSGYTSLKATMTDIGKKVNTDIEYTTDLADFTDKTTLGAIKETAKDKNVADEYDGTQTYDKGDVVIYKNTLYICTTNNTTGTWDASKWSATTVQSLIGSLSTLTTTVKSSLVGAVNEVNGKGYNDLSGRPIRSYNITSSNPVTIQGQITAGYATFIIIGFAEGLGGVVLAVEMAGGNLSKVINLLNGQNFSSTHLSFSGSNSQLTISADISATVMIFG